MKSIKSRWLGGRYGYMFINDNEKNVSTFMKDISYELGVDITHHQVCRCKILSLKDQYSNVDDQYKLLWSCAKDIRSNPGSTVIIGISDSFKCPRFDMLYICFRAVKGRVFIGRRPLIRVDGCHLKGPRKGILLSIVGVIHVSGFLLC